MHSIFNILVPDIFPSIARDKELTSFLYALGFLDYSRKHVELEDDVFNAQVVIIPSRSATLTKNAYLHYVSYVESNRICIRLVMKENGVDTYTKVVEYSKSSYDAHTKLTSIANKYANDDYSDIVLVPEKVTILKLLN